MISILNPLSSIQASTSIIHRICSFPTSWICDSMRRLHGRIKKWQSTANRSCSSQGKAMIVGLLVRNFKTYQAINYLQISNGKCFSALVGANGAGKSSVLEALNSFFNGADWNYHHSLSRGFKER